MKGERKEKKMRRKSTDIHSMLSDDDGEKNKTPSVRSASQKINQVKRREKKNSRPKTKNNNSQNRQNKTCSLLARKKQQPELAVPAHPGIEFLPHERNLVINAIFLLAILAAIRTISRFLGAHAHRRLDLVIRIQHPTIRLGRPAISIMAQNAEFGRAAHDAEERIGFVADNDLARGLDLLAGRGESEGAIGGRRVAGAHGAVAVAQVLAACEGGAADVSETFCDPEAGMECGVGRRHEFLGDGSLACLVGGGDGDTLDEVGHGHFDVELDEVG